MWLLIPIYFRVYKKAILLCIRSLWSCQWFNVASWVPYHLSECLEAIFPFGLSHSMLRYVLWVCLNNLKDYLSRNANYYFWYDDFVFLCSAMLCKYEELNILTKITPLGCSIFFILALKGIKDFGLWHHGSTKDFGYI